MSPTRSRLLAALVMSTFLASPAPAAPPSSPAAATPGPPAPTSTTSAPTLDTLMAAFAAMPGLEASFVEDKHMQLLAAPLTSSGRLYFTGPGYLARRVERPQPSEIVITPRALRIGSGAAAEHIDLGARPDVKLFVESFVRVLAGDRAGLETIYDIAFVSDPAPPAPTDAAPDPTKAAPAPTGAAPAASGAAWTLTLKPKGPPLSQLIASLRIRGRGLAVDEIRVDETSGDYAVTRIRDVDPARTFTPDERTRLFGVGTPPR